MTRMRVAMPAPGYRDTVFGLAVAFAVLFGLAYAGASWLSGYVPWSIDLALPLDAHVPFLPWTALVYITITPMLCLAPFVLRTPERMRRLFHAATVATVLGACCFVLLPVSAGALESRAQDASLPFRLADAMNLERNYFPSLHVALALLCVFAYGEQASRGMRWALAAWGAAVAASTVLTQQHFLLDVVGGAVLAAACWRRAPARAGRSRWLDALETELLCLANFARFSRRHRRYLGISIAVLAGSLPRYRANRLLRTGFAFLQAVDDLLDGDRASAAEPLDVAAQLIHALERGEFGDDDLSRLAAAFRRDLLARGGDAALAEAIALLRTMQADRVRVLEQRLLDAAALRRQLNDTFRHSVDLLLLAAGAHARSAQVPALIDAFAWCSTVRDLDEDLARGLVNIPREVVAEARVADLRDAVQVRRDPAVASWLRAEAARAERDLDEADRSIAELDDAKTRRILGRFARSMRRYLARFPDRDAPAQAQSSAISG